MDGDERTCTIVQRRYGCGPSGRPGRSSRTARDVGPRSRDVRLRAITVAVGRQGRPTSSAAAVSSVGFVAFADAFPSFTDEVLEHRLVALGSLLPPFAVGGFTIPSMRP